MPTRYSSGLISLGTPTRMMPPWLFCLRLRPVTRGRPIISARPGCRNESSGGVAYRQRGIMPMQKRNVSQQSAVSGQQLMVQPTYPSKPRVLVLDEDRIILQSLSQFLRREGYDVRTTDRPEEALALMEV